MNLFETIRKKLEEKGNPPTDRQEDDCSKCAYEFRVMLNQLSHEVTAHMKASCVTIIEKKDLLAKVDAERAEVAILKALRQEYQKNQNQDSK